MRTTGTSARSCRSTATCRRCGSSRITLASHALDADGTDRDPVGRRRWERTMTTKTAAAELPMLEQTALAVGARRYVTTRVAIPEEMDPTGLAKEIRRWAMDPEPDDATSKPTSVWATKLFIALAWQF